MRQTRQRELILATLVEAEGPLSVGEIYARARSALPGIGIATVYRTLKLLLAEDRAIVVELPGVEPHYEPAGRGHHHHFRCRDCQQWFELPSCLVPFLDGTTLREGFVVEGHDLTLHGRCPACAGALHL